MNFYSLFLIFKEYSLQYLFDFSKELIKYFFIIRTHKNSVCSFCYFYYLIIFQSDRYVDLESSGSKIPRNPNNP